MQAATTPGDNSESPLVGDALTAERLVVLRLTLDRALEQARDDTIVGRHMAVLLLQSVCELCVNICLDWLGEQRNDRAGLAVLFPQLARVHPTGNLSAVSGWPAIMRLDTARNSAHHHGNTPDPVQVGHWGTATERFVRSLISAVLGMDLRTVTTSEAVASPEIRRLFAEAESALRGGDCDGAVRQALEAFDVARDEWRRQRGSITELPTFLTQDGVTNPAVEKALRRIEQAELVRPFTTDVAAYLWVEEVRSSLPEAHGMPLAPITPDDAARVLAFVLAWLLRWESFTRSYDLGRQQRYRNSLRPPDSGDADVGPSVDASKVDVRSYPLGSSMSGQGGIAFSLQLQIVDAPELGFRAWLGDVRARLWQLNPECVCDIDDQGRVIVRGLSANDDPAHFVVDIRESIAWAEQRRLDRLASMESWRAQAGTFQSSFSMLQEVVTDTHGRAVFDGVSVEPSAPLTADDELPLTLVVLRLSDSGRAIVGERAFEVVLLNSPATLHGALARRPGYVTLDGRLDPAEAKAILVNAVAAAESAIEHRSEEDRRAQEVRHRMVEQVRAALLAD
jgi:hypothetical protein